MDAENMAGSDVPQLQNEEMEKEINIQDLPSLALADKDKLPNCSAVYFAFSEIGQILYVGSALNLRIRWAQHAQTTRLPTDSTIAWIETPEDQLRIVESVMVQRLNPTLNKLRPCADLRAGLVRESDTRSDVYLCKCKRCKYEWVPRTTKKPRQCPKCWTTNWNLPKGKSK